MKLENADAKDFATKSVDEFVFIICPACAEEIESSGGNFSTAWPTIWELELKARDHIREKHST